MALRAANVVEPGHREALVRRVVRERADLAHERADRPAQLEGAAEPVAVPERKAPWDTGGGRDEDAVAGDLLDPPRGGAEREHVAHPGLVDHLLVQLAHPAAAPPRVGAGQEDAEQAPVGDRAARGDRQALRAGTPGHGPGRPVPDHARAQLGEGVGGIPAREHVQSGGERGLGQRGERRRPPHQVLQVVDVPLVHGGHGHDLLGEDVERVGRDFERLDPPVPHALGDHRRLDQVAAHLREEDAAGDGPDLVARAADPLEARGDRRRGLDLDDEVDRAHVDAELQTGGGDDGPQPPGFEVAFHLRALLFGDRAVVGAGQHGRRARGGRGRAHHLRGPVVFGEFAAGLALVLDLVEAAGESLGGAAGVGEDDRRTVLLDEVGDALLHVRPDGGGRAGLGGRGRGRVRGLAEVAHVLDGDDHREVPLLFRRRLDDHGVAARGQEAGDLLDRADGRGEADPAGRLRQQRVQPLQGERQVRAALGARDGVHLVEDHRLHAGQRLACFRGQHQEQRFGRRDQDVRRAGGDLAALGLRGVTGAHSDSDVGCGQAEPLRFLADAGQRRAEVALHVDAQCFQRREVQDPAAQSGLVGRGRGGQVVQGRHERRECLARACGRHDQHVLVLAQGLPGAFLGGGRGTERAREPGGGGRGEPVQRSMRSPGGAIADHAVHAAPPLAAARRVPALEHGSVSFMTPILPHT